VGKFMKLSRTVVYALQAVCQLATQGAATPVASRKLAQAGHMPDRFLLQILRNLVSSGLLVSTRGVIGGYTLARSPDQISLLDVIEAVEGPVSLEIVEPTFEQPDLQSALREVTAHVRRELDALKVSHLLAAERRGEVA
jgi:Rrf2 family protein